MYKVGDKVKYVIPNNEELLAEAQGDGIEPLIHLAGKIGKIKSIDNKNTYVVNFGDETDSHCYNCELVPVISGKNYLPGWL